jgi:hypothetical protein
LSGPPPAFGRQEGELLSHIDADEKLLNNIGCDLGFDPIFPSCS